MTNNGVSIESFEGLEVVDGEQTKVADVWWDGVTGDIQDDQTWQFLNTTITHNDHKLHGDPGKFHKYTTDQILTIL